LLRIATLKLNEPSGHAPFHWKLLIFRSWRRKRRFRSGPFYWGKICFRHCWVII